jgi:hypothetical protein
MAQRRHHYEQAFEAFLRDQRIPYVSVNEAKKALLPAGATLRLEPTGPESGVPAKSLKNFDFVVYGSGLNLLAEVKGRKLAARVHNPARASPASRRLESWVNAEDVRSMLAWQQLFGPEFRAAFIFIYWCDELPADGLFEEIVEHRGRWYALRAVSVEDYAQAMRVRSQRWGTVHVDGATFGRISHPFRGSLSSPGGPSAGGIGLPAPALEPIGA